MDDQGYQLLIASLNETKASSQKAADGIARVELALADLGVQRRLVALENFRKKWEPLFYKVTGASLALVFIVQLAFKIFWK